ncbi:MAG: GC-type dockerin domain-anchored protein [Planctomycetota bacterium]|jgi:uncharacterized membrane protein
MHLATCSRPPRPSIATGTSLLCAVSFAPAALGQGTFEDLGPGLTASDASGNGAMVVGTTPAEYFYWTAKTGVVLIGGTAPGSGVGGQAKISDDGSRMVGTALDPATGLQAMSVYEFETGTWTPLGGIGSSSGGETSSAWGISGDGSPPEDLGSTVKGRSSRANDCDEDGSVVVGWQDAPSGTRQGAIWVDGVQSILTSTAGGVLGEAGDCSADGTWVVGSGNFSTNFNAWRWSAETGGVVIGTPPSFGWRGASVAISADGDTVVGFYRPFPGPATFGRGFIWFEEEGQQDLTDFAIAAGIDIPADVVLALPLGMSPDGNTIVGIARGGSGTFGFRLRFEAECPADLDGDGEVGGSDLAVLLAAWGTDDPEADLSGDGSVGGDDLAILLAAWGGC